MRILILNHNLREHGTYFRAWPIARGLAEKGHEIVMATVSPDRLYRTTKIERDGVLVYETPKWTWPLMEADEGWGPLGILERAKIAGLQKFDWVYSFAHTPNCHFPARFAMLRGARLAVDWCDDYGAGIFPQREALREASPHKRRMRWFVQRLGEKHEARMETAILRKAERVTVISEILREKAIAACVPPEKILLVPSGADLDLFSPKTQAKARLELGLPETGRLIVYIANYHPDEHFLMSVLREVFAKVADARMAYTGPMFDSAGSKEPVIRDRLIHLGKLPMERVPLVVASGDVALIPMDDTPHNRARCPQKLMDYLASGRPIVTSDVGEVGRLFRQHPEIGRASKPTVETYSRDIVELLETPQERREEMGRAARHLAESYYNWPRAINAIEQFLTK